MDLIREKYSLHEDIQYSPYRSVLCAERLNLSKQYDCRLKINGSSLYIRYYSRPFVNNTCSSSPARPHFIGSVKYRKQVLSRARRSLYDIVECNPDMRYFVTLTFADNVDDLRYANECFEYFIKRLRYYLGFNFKYLVVPEFQKRGAVHFHMLTNTGYIPASALSRIWSFGFVRINKVDRVTNLCAYVAKYITADSCDLRLLGMRSFRCSRNCKRPLICRTIRQNANDFLYSLLPSHSLKSKSKYIFNNQYLSFIDVVFKFDKKLNLRIFDKVVKMSNYIRFLS